MKTLSVPLKNVFEYMTGHRIIKFPCMFKAISFARAIQINMVIKKIILLDVLYFYYPYYILIYKASMFDRWVIRYRYIVLLRYTTFNCAKKICLITSFKRVNIQYSYIVKCV